MLLGSLQRIQNLGAWMEPVSSLSGFLHDPGAGLFRHELREKWLGVRNENDPRADQQKTKESICFRVLVKKSLPRINGRGVKGMAPSEPLGTLIRHRTVASTFTSLNLCVCIF